MRVLYVDDDRVNTLLFAELCRVVGDIEVETAESAAEALALLSRLAVDVLVVDLNLGDGDGIELLPALRRATGRDVPAYLCTADDVQGIAARARQAGYAECWRKPIESVDLLQQLKRHGAASA